MQLYPHFLNIYNFIQDFFVQEYKTYDFSSLTLMSASVLCIIELFFSKITFTELIVSGFQDICTKNNRIKKEVHKQARLPQ